MSIEVKKVEGLPPGMFAAGASKAEVVAVGKLHSYPAEFEGARAQFILDPSSVLVCADGFVRFDPAQRRLVAMDATELAAHLYRTAFGIPAEIPARAA